MELKEELYGELLTKIKEKYTLREQKRIMKAYYLAEQMHEGQLRKSGEPYIVHPLSVSLILITLGVDADTVCAGLLHDIAEDTPITIDNLRKMFNVRIAILVDGVSKPIECEDVNKDEEDTISLRKQFAFYYKDPRVIAIKLADRLHNMRTLKAMKPHKQIEKSIETLQIYVPVATKIGAYGLKNDLEDLSYLYLQPKIYHKIQKERAKIQNENLDDLIELLEKTKEMFYKEGIDCKIIYQIKNIYGISKQIINNTKLNDIHDLFTIKVITKNKKDCYRVKEILQSKYKNYPEYERDYLKNPKPNGYHSIHTTVKPFKDQFIQFQIRTEKMDLVSDIGIFSYWQLYGDKAKLKMRKALNKYGFEVLKEINKEVPNNKEFIELIKKDVFGKQITVYDNNGIAMELPNGSTAVDFAYRLHTEIGNHMIGAIVNGSPVPLNYILKDNDYVAILTCNELVIQNEANATTYYARRRIRKAQKS